MKLQAVAADERVAWTRTLARLRPWLMRGVPLCLIAWLVAAYVLLPFAWRLIGRHHPALDGMPRVALTKDGIPGDPLNIALVGNGDEIVAAMLHAGWFPADPITLKSSLRIAASTMLRRPYETAPMSHLFVWGRKQDLAFQQPIGKDPRRRHHVRFWRSDEVDENNRPLWAGAATLDASVGLSRTTGQVTHHIDANVDAERDKLLGDLAETNPLLKIDWIDDFHTQLSGRNGGGDPWYTDGRLPIVALNANAHATLGTHEGE